MTAMSFGATSSPPMAQWPVSAEAWSASPVNVTVALKVSGASRLVAQLVTVSRGSLGDSQ